MPRLKILNVFTRDEINLCIPFSKIAQPMFRVIAMQLPQSEEIVYVSNPLVFLEIKICLDK